MWILSMGGGGLPRGGIVGGGGGVSWGFVGTVCLGRFCEKGFIEGILSWMICPMVGEIVLECLRSIFIN